MTPAGEAKLLTTSNIADASFAQWCGGATAQEQAQLIGLAAQKMMGYPPPSFGEMRQVRMLLDALAAQWPKDWQEHRACVGFLRWMYPEHVNANPISIEALYRLPRLADEMNEVMIKRTTTTTTHSMPYKTLAEMIGVSASEEAIVWMWDRKWLREEEWGSVVVSWLRSQRTSMPLILDVVRPLWGDRALGKKLAQFGQADILETIDLDWTQNHGMFLGEAYLHRNTSAISFLERHIDPLHAARAFFDGLSPHNMFLMATQIFQRLSPTDPRSVQLVGLINHHCMKNHWAKILKQPEHQALRGHMKAITHNKKLLEAVAGLAEQKSAGAVRKM